MYDSAYDRGSANIVAKHKNPSRTLIISLAILGALSFSALLLFLARDINIALLSPKGLIASEQHRLFVTSTLIMLGFGVPVILTVYFFIWKYRESNPSVTYAPDTKGSKAFLTFAWGGPLVIVAILAYLMLPATQRLEPQRPIASDKEQLTVQVVALNWKWLFIYPEQDIATVNFVQIPVDTPVRFELTADEAPMNSFWIPNLGGMLYAMTGHVNPLHLMADTIGSYPGGAAEVNGRGLAGMRFTTYVSSKTDFDSWVKETKRSLVSLDDAEYQKLLAPSENNEPAFYASPTPGLYDTIVSKYSGSHHHMSEEQGNH
jgi:cytochrome o ubiquinol oxidase subunit 2